MFPVVLSIYIIPVYFTSLLLTGLSCNFFCVVYGNSPFSIFFISLLFIIYLNLLSSLQLQTALSYFYAHSLSIFNVILLCSSNILIFYSKHINTNISCMLTVYIVTPLICNHYENFILLISCY